MDASPLELFNYTIERFIRTSSVRRDSTLEDAARAMRMTVGSKQFRYNTVAKVRDIKLAGDSTFSNFAVIATSKLPCLSIIEKRKKRLLLNI